MSYSKNTDYNKTEILKECRKLLNLINCEIVVDISDGQLFNILFQSDVKKETLLKWLIQQMFSLEECTKNSIENLTSMFIPKSQFRSFLIGTMPIAEQFKKWKLIMSVLHTKQKWQNINETIDYEQQLLDGSLLEEYESIWSEKLDFNPKYFSSGNEKPKKIDINEIQADLDRCKSQLAQLKSEEKPTPKQQLVEMDDTISSILERYQRATENLNEAVDKELIPHLNANRKPEQYSFRYDSLDAAKVKHVTKNAKILHNIIETLNNVLHGVENFGGTEGNNTE